MTGENQAGGEPKRLTFRGNHRDQLNGRHQFLMFMHLHLSVSHLAVVLVSKTDNLTRRIQHTEQQTGMLKHLYFTRFLTY